MSSLPYECLAHIIECIDEPPTLSKLLRVNKVIFHITAEQLYREPIRYLRNWTSTPLVLFRGLLLLSSVNDSSIQVVRQALNAPLRKECDPPLMLDYLRYIRIFDLCFDTNDDFCRKFLHDYPGYPRKHDLWYAIVGNHLSSLQELGIEPGDIQRYIDLAPQLSSITKIVILDPWRKYLDQVKALILAIQQHHGPSQLADCEFYPSFFSHTFEQDVAPSVLLEVFSLLPSHKSPPLTYPHANGPTAVLHRPMDRELSRLKSTRFSRNAYDTPNFRLCYPDLSASQILQRCRGLKGFTAEVTRENMDLFSWAVHEMEQRRQQGSGKLKISPVNLERLTLTVYGHTALLAPQPNADDWIMTPVDDALRGFCHSLEEIELVIGECIPLPKLQWKLPMTCPHLFELELSLPWRMTFDATDMWDQAPGLERLRLGVSIPRGQWWPLGVRGSLDPGSGFRVCHPTLRELVLEGGAVLLFDPASLDDLPRVQHFTLNAYAHHARYLLDSTRSIYGHLYADSDDVNNTSLHGGSTSFFPNTLFPWTWTWSLPSLRELYLNLAPTIVNFKSFDPKRYPNVSVYYPDI